MKLVTNMLLPVATVILVICTIVHASTCLMTSASMCALVQSMGEDGTVATKVLNSIALTAAVLVLIFCVPALAQMVISNKLSSSVVVSIVVLLYLVVSAIMHASYCLAGKPICGLSNNIVAVKIHNVLLMFGAAYILLFTQLTHFKTVQ